VVKCSPPRAFPQDRAPRQTKHPLREACQKLVFGLRRGDLADGSWQGIP
jgi:hypothetical protein